ncbi:MAG TPA: PRC-barrel domain-containing protein [Armatimonadota bacterium]|jgi:hypothetical protein
MNAYTLDCIISEGEEGRRAFDRRFRWLCEIPHNQLPPGWPRYTGWRVVDAQGRRSGVVEDLVVDGVLNRPYMALVRTGSLLGGSSLFLVPLRLLAPSGARSLELAAPREVLLRAPRWSSLWDENEVLSYWAPVGDAAWVESGAPAR